MMFSSPSEVLPALHLTSFLMPRNNINKLVMVFFQQKNTSYCHLDNKKVSCVIKQSTAFALYEYINTIDYKFGIVALHTAFREY